MKFFILTLALFMPLSANAKSHSVDYDQSSVSFSGTHAGDEFNGVFEEFNTTIQFDDQNLDQSSVTVTFNTASAKTGNGMYDGTLPTGDWFDSKSLPEAMFQSTSFTKNDNGYSVTGDLTIKEITHPITFDFTLEGETPTIMGASFPIDRLSFDIGKGSDPKAEWVSQNIEISVKIVAN